MNEPRSDPAWRRQFHWAVLGDLGLVPAPDAQVLDFGCGAGEGVYQLRKAGVRAFGTDTRADWADCQRKHIDEALARAGEEVFRVTNTLPYRIPFDDDTFDLLLSDQVFEHVQNYAEVIAETHRVLKPGGVALHEFPARWNPIERHVYVPLAGVLRSRPYLTLWAFLGIRNSFQKGRSFREVAALNFEYLRAQTNYLSGEQIERQFKECFPDTRFLEGLFVKHSRGRVRHLWPMIRPWPLLARLVSAFHTRFVFCRKD